MSYDATGSRFLRPPDVARLRRNQRRIQVQRALVVGRNLLVLAAVTGGVVWAWREARSSERFAVQSVEVAGTVHTPTGAIEQIAARYRGMNLFEIDLARVQKDLDAIGWIRRIDIEKTLPGKLRIKVTERTPVALVRRADRLHYVDDEGAVFAELSPRTGNRDLPIISEAEGAELHRSVVMLNELAGRNPEIYSRISELWPIPPRGFALFDRSLGAVVYANQDDLAVKYDRLHAILTAENHPKIRYADLRFDNRVIVKPHVVVQGVSREPTTGEIPSRASLPHDDGGEYVQN